MRKFIAAKISQRVDRHFVEKKERPQKKYRIVLCSVFLLTTFAPNLSFALKKDDFVLISDSFPRKQITKLPNIIETEIHPKMLFYSDKKTETPISVIGHFLNDNGTWISKRRFHPGPTDKSIWLLFVIQSQIEKDIILYHPWPSLEVDVHFINTSDEEVSFKRAGFVFQNDLFYVIII